MQCVRRQCVTAGGIPSGNDEKITVAGYTTMLEVGVETAT
jgi:hypothetical protein